MKIEDIFYDIPKLETDRLMLRKLCINDANDMFQYTSNPAVSKYTTWHEHKSLEDTRSFLRRIITTYENRKGMTWGIENKENGKLIGTCDFVTWVPELKRAEIGYALSKDYWNKGYMTEVVKTLILFGFTNMELVRIEAKCRVENIGSARVMEKAGMNFEGILRKYLLSKDQFYDVKMHSVVKEEQ